MRLTRHRRRRPAQAIPRALVDAVKAAGFFPGPRVAFVEDADDGAAPPTRRARRWRTGSRATRRSWSPRGQLTARVDAAQAFEGHRNAYAVADLRRPARPGRDRGGCWRAAGLRDVPAPAMAALDALARALDPGDFRQTVEKLALYKLGDPDAAGAATISPRWRPARPRRRWTIAERGGRGAHRRDRRR